MRHIRPRSVPNKTELTVLIEKLVPILRPIKHGLGKALPRELLHLREMIICDAELVFTVLRSKKPAPSDELPRLRGESQSCWLHR